MNSHVIKSIFNLCFVSVLLFSGCVKKQDSSQNNVQTSTQSQTSSAPSNENEILIGQVGSLTGGQATFGTSTDKGVQLAINQANAAGGVNGKKLKVITLDDQGKPEEAAIAVTKLITQDKVVAILGEVASSRSLAMAPIAQANKVPMITPSSTNPDVTKKGDYIFRVCFIDPFQGSVMAKFARNSLKAKSAAILRDVKNDYSVGLANFFTDTFKKLGGTIVVDQSYSEGDADFKSQLTSIKNKKPDVIFVPGYYTEVGMIAKQAKEQGLKQPLLGGDGWDSEKLIEGAGDSLNGSFFSNHYSPDDTSPRVQNFIKDFQAVYNSVPDGLAAMGYDAAIILIDAMKKAKSLAGNDLREAIAATKDFAAVTGNITINADRDAVKSAVILEIKDKKYVFKEKINP